MLSIRPALLSLAIMALLIPAAMPAHAQPPGQTAADFYLAYRTVFDKAKSVDELLPYMATATRAKVEATPAEERAEMFDMIKTFDTTRSIKVLKEAKTETGVTLTVEGVDEDGAKLKGTIEIVKENGAWKLAKERWSGS
jgi:hypothetical protein